MKHARPDYNRIQDPSGKIPTDEPVFLIRGHDPSGPGTLIAWAELNHSNGGDPKLTMMTYVQSTHMLNWQLAHPELVKPADFIAREPPADRTPSIQPVRFVIAYIPDTTQQDKPYYLCLEWMYHTSDAWWTRDESKAIGFLDPKTAINCLEIWKILTPDFQTEFELCPNTWVGIATL